MALRRGLMSTFFWSCPVCLRSSPAPISHTEPDDCMGNRSALNAQMSRKRRRNRTRPFGTETSDVTVCRKAQNSTCPKLGVLHCSSRTHLQQDPNHFVPQGLVFSLQLAPSLCLFCLPPPRFVNPLRGKTVTVRACLWQRNQASGQGG